MSDAPVSLANALSDRYTIERLLGYGGMATVHLAEERKHKRLGYAYFYARKYEQAHYHLDRAIAMNPTADESFRIQGLILTLQKQFPAAERMNFGAPAA